MRFHNFWCISFLSSEFLNHVQKTPKSWEKICSITIFHQDPEKTLLQAWKPLKIAFFLPTSFSDNHGQKSWDTFAFLGRFPIHTGPTLPSPHKQCWTRVSSIFSEFQLCIRWGEGELQENFENAALTRLFGDWVETRNCCCRHFFVKISRLHIMHISALRWTEFHPNRKDPIWRKKTANF